MTDWAAKATDAQLQDAQLQDAQLQDAQLPDGMSWETYRTEAVPALLLAGGKPRRAAVSIDAVIDDRNFHLELPLRAFLAAQA